jgi:hypothetical protein
VTGGRDAQDRPVVALDHDAAQAPGMGTAEVSEAVCPLCLLDYTGSGPYARHRRWECPAVNERNDVRDAAQAAGLPRDAALWRLLDVIDKRARAEAADAERERIAEAVRGLPAYENDGGDPDTYIYDPAAVYREAVLRIIGEADRG